MIFDPVPTRKQEVKAKRQEDSDEERLDCRGLKMKYKRLNRDERSVFNEIK